MNKFRIFLTIFVLSAMATTIHADDSLMKFLSGKNGTNEIMQNQPDKKEAKRNGLIGRSSAVISPFMSKSLKRKGDMTSATERYYTNAARQFGWWIGLGKPLSKTEAQNSDCYYRLYDKNDKGRWQRVEYVCNDHSRANRPRIERLGSLIATDLADDRSNHEIINSAVAWEFISDPTGALMLEERGFDVGGNLLYIMNSTEYSEGRFVLSFLGSNGLPMFPNRTLHVQCDTQGRFSIINFTDDAGYYFPNAEDVYEIRIDYSPSDYKFINCNIAGNPL